MITLREARLPEDAAAILRLDMGFTTDEIYIAYRDGDQMGLRVTMLETPITKRFPLDDLERQDRAWEFAVVALEDERICGFVAVGYQAWNRRLTLWHLYVDGRRGGAGWAAACGPCGGVREHEGCSQHVA